MSDYFFEDPNTSVSATSISTSSSLTDYNLESEEMQVTPMEKKRKSRRGPSVNFSAQYKNVKETDQGKRKRESTNGDGEVKDDTERRNKLEDKKVKQEKKVVEEAPTVGYIHVRARRGQATDSHSLAERVRREKISERMKILQGLVPGCDKVTGKALILDEIINYVQSLQNQVEFLSMKLASENPMFYDCGWDILDTPTVGLNHDINMQQCNPTMSTTQIAAVVSEAKSDLTMPTRIAHCDYQFIDSPTSLLFQESHLLNPFNQGNGQLLWDMDNQRPKIQ